MVPTFELPDSQSPCAFRLFKKANGTLSIVAGTYTGWFYWADLVEGAWSLRFQERLFKKSIRALQPLSSGAVLVASASGRLSQVDVDLTVMPLSRPKDQEGQSIDISSLCILDDQSADRLDLAIGDDYGNVYIVRYSFTDEKWENLLTVQEQDDSISALLHHAHRKTLLAASGDGTILVLDLKKLKIVAHTSSLDDEIMAMAFDAAGNVLCTSGLGAIVRYKWGYWGKVAFRLKPSFHSASPIHAICIHPSSDVIAFTGTADGALRRLNISGDVVVDSVVDTFDEAIDSLEAIEAEGKPLCAVLRTSDRFIRFVPLDHNVKEELPTGSMKKTRSKPQTDQIHSFFADL